MTTLTQTNNAPETVTTTAAPRAHPDALDRLLSASFSAVPGQKALPFDGTLLDAPAIDQLSACQEDYLPTPSAGLPINRVDITVHYLSTLADVLEDERADFLDAVEELRERHEESLVDAIARLTREGKPQEEFWASITRLFEAAREPSSGLLERPITFIRANVADLMRDEEAFQELCALVPSSTSFDQDQLYSMLVFYEPIRSKVAYKRIGQLCRDARALAILDFGSMPWKRAVATFGVGGAFETLQSNDAENEHVMLVGNRIRVREPSCFLPGDEGTFVNIAPLVAGSIVAGDAAPNSCIALARAGFKRQMLVRTMDGSDPELEWELPTTDEADKVRPLNPVVRIKDRLALWGISTLSRDPLRGQYPVVRVEEWLKKCLANFLLREVLELDGGEDQQDALRERIDGFFRDYSDPSDSSKPFRGGKVDGQIRRSPDNPSHFEVDVRVQFKLSITKFKVRIMKFVAVPSNQREGYDLEHVGTTSAKS